MQGRMKHHRLTNEESEKLLLEENVGRIATINPDGSPYIVPVHFVYCNGKIYIHGLIKGQKIDNINLNPNVCFEVDRMQELILSDKPCDVNTAYQSVIIIGTARLIPNEKDKEDILRQIIKKYVPALAGEELPPRMLNATSVIEIEPIERTGKYYK
jgi:Predicted flavin-nucleotide-binding protein